MNLDLSYLDSTSRLLGSLPTRKQLKQTPKLPTNRTLKIRVERNFPFEFISNLLSPFLELWESNSSIEFSEYDTSLSNIFKHKHADVYILWIDWRVYSESMTAEEAVTWLEERIHALKSETGKPILLNNWPEYAGLEEMLFSSRMTERGWVRELNVRLSQLLNDVTGCEIMDLASLACRLEDSFFDDRNDEITHYPFSDKATIMIARHLGVHLLPAICLPRLKAVALDLDDTLYSGVLGEEGIDGLKCSEGHLQLQKLLLRLKRSGILLTICSHNEEKDVKALFDNRTDFPLNWGDFSAIRANWLPKTENINTLALKLNIDPSAFLFIDDNPAELLKIAGSLPSVRLLHADPEGRTTMEQLCHYPGLYQFHSNQSDLLRNEDIQANQTREKLRKSAVNYNMYLENLQITLRIYENHLPHMNRLYELSQKTNQFNLALHRMSQTDSQEFMEKNHYLSSTVQLADRLTDSGIIGAFVCKLVGEKATLIEVLFSCRALGRDIETVAFSLFLKKLINRGVGRLNVNVTEGPRNQPARDWLTRFVNGATLDLSVAKLHQRVQNACWNYPAEVEEIL